MRNFFCFYDFLIIWNGCFVECGVLGCDVICCGGGCCGVGGGVRFVGKVVCYKVRWR